MTDESHNLQPGSDFGQHRIVRLLGRGGMGEVYEVEHELTGDRHALKLLSAEVMEVPGALERFQREAKVMARLKHSGIVRVDFAGEDEGRHWLRMEMMPGREVQGKRVITLEEYVEAKGGRLPESEVRKLTEEILEALGHAHGQGLVHRDLKPANVLLDGERLKIADFGLVNAAGAEWMDTQVRSTVINQDEEDTLIDDGSGTGSRSRAIMGTYAYMSPEQRDGLPADARSDLYAVGLMVFRMLTGLKSPGMERPSELGMGLDTGWDAWLIRALKEKQSDRFPTAVEMKDTLSFEEAPVAPAPVAKPQVAKPQAPVRKAPEVRGHSANQGVRTGVSTPQRSKPAKGKVWPYLLGIVAVVLAGLFVWSPWSGDYGNGFTSPQSSDVANKESRMGKALFGTLESTEATGIEIVEIDEEELEAKSFQVAKEEKGWLIRRAGKADYPANADNQVKKVSSILFDLTILDTASEDSGEHRYFGVLDPSKALPSDQGVGKMISIKNSSGYNLAQLIIGRSVEGLGNVHYVRKPFENNVYTAEVQNVNDVSTKFVDWVEKDFLDLDKWNVKRVTLDNYEVNLAQGQLKRDTPAFVLDYDNSEWKLSGSSLSDKEELVKDKLDKMKDALDDLKIIDVQRKPEILVNNLKQGNEFFSNLKDAKNQAVVESLQQKGFYTVAVTNPAGQRVPKVVSNKGEILVGMKDGVEYVLRFGETYRGPGDDENSTGDSRYIYAFARVNPSLLDPPALESMQKEFQSKVEKAQERVKALNENLSNWYYVISNEVYEKIRLERKDFVRVKEEDGKARPEEVKASHILISYKGAERADADITRSKEEAKTEAERIRKLIVDEGKDFAEMASEHSNGPSKTKGGDLGKFKFEAMAPSFSAAAFVLEVGTVSDVVETGFGFHVIKRTE